MTESPQCTQCQSVHVYQDRALWICPECGHEWTDHPLSGEDSENSENLVKDANGNILNDGDSVIVIKDLKIKGSSGVVKGGTKIRSIRITDAGDGHNIACKIDGLGSINLKSEYLKKA